jgi:hypothetical protein
MEKYLWHLINHGKALRWGHYQDLIPLAAGWGRHLILVMPHAKALPGMKSDFSVQNHAQTPESVTSS